MVDGCFLYSPSFSAITLEGGRISWIAVLGALNHIWRPEVTDGCDISCLLTWQEISSFNMGNEITEKFSRALLFLSYPIFSIEPVFILKCVLVMLRLFATPWSVACQALGPWYALGKNTRVGCHFPLQGNLPNPGISHIPHRFFTI